MWLPFAISKEGLQLFKYFSLDIVDNFEQMNFKGFGALLVTKMLQLQGDNVFLTPYQGSALDPMYS